MLSIVRHIFSGNPVPTGELRESKKQETISMNTMHVTRIYVGMEKARKRQRSGGG